MALRRSRERPVVTADGAPARCDPHLHGQASQKSLQGLGASLNSGSQCILKNLGLQPSSLTSAGMPARDVHKDTGYKHPTNTTGAQRTT